jgi:hypothetical protein
VRLDLRDGVQRDADHDQQGRAAEVEGHVQLRDEDGRQDANGGNIERAHQRDARQDTVDVLGGALPRADAGNETAELLHVLGDVARVERDRRIKIAEEDHQRDEQHVVQHAAAVEQVVHRLAHG